MRPFGLALILVAIAMPLVWFVPIAAEHDPIAVFSQYLGSAALIAMGIAQLMATRVAGLETVFGGLDRIYVLHKWIAIGAIAAVLLHDTIDADINGLGRETGLTELAETLGEISLYGFLILAVISVATFIPYHLWRWTHRLMGAFFALSAFHYIFIVKPFSTTDPVGLYVLGFCVLGITSYAYTLMPFAWAQGRHRYRVASAEKDGDALVVTLTPEGRGMRHRQGQFGFVKFQVPGLGEVHPFTISQAPDDDRRLRFTIKDLGDFTGRLDGRLTSGARALVSGPYGRFHHRRMRTPEVWIAAGVGVTPFVGLADALEPASPPVHLFYCVKRRDRATHLHELEAIAASKPNLHLHVTESAPHGRLSADQILETAGTPAADLTAYFCGPAAMRGTLKRDLVARGLSVSRFHYEEFEIRTGIGLGRLSAWLFNRMIRGVGGSASPQEAGG